jgi:hypothetical protein
LVLEYINKKDSNKYLIDLTLLFYKKNLSILYKIMKNKTILFVVLLTIFIITIYNSFNKNKVIEQLGGRGGGGRGGGGGLRGGGLGGGGLGGVGYRRGLGVGALGLGAYGRLYGRGGGGYYGDGGGDGYYGYNNPIQDYYYPNEELPIVYNQLL